MSDNPRDKLLSARAAFVAARDLKAATIAGMARSTERIDWPGQADTLVRLQAGIDAVDRALLDYP